jgi:exodeoxyribonuclease VII large subunit
MIRALSVKQFNEYVKSSFKHDPIFQNLHIKGEIANYKISHNHLYFSLKEDSEIIDCVIYYFEEKDIELNFLPGDQVEVYGNLLLYSYSSRLVINVKKIEEFGISEKYKEFLKLKEEFTRLGYFDQARKKEIPKLAKKVGLITSKDGAALVDFVSVINQKANDINIFFYPVKVQGQSARDEIITALKTLEEKNMDCIVVTRGGGSDEDLSVFNDRLLIEYIYTMKTPIISAIGHKIDQTLIDFVADLSLQTPTEAGSKLIENYVDLEKNITNIYKEMTELVRKNIQIKEIELSYIKKQIELLSPGENINSRLKELKESKKKLVNLLSNNLNYAENKLKMLKLMLDSNQKMLEVRKRSILVKNMEGEEIYSKYSVGKNDLLKILFSDGEILVEVKDE